MLNLRADRIPQRSKPRALPFGLSVAFLLGCANLCGLPLFIAPAPQLSAQVSGKVPAGYVQVPKDAPLPPGTKLRIYQSFRWNDLTVLSLNKDGTIRVRFVGRPESWDNDFKRESLIISQPDLDKLKDGPPSENDNPDPNDPAPEEPKPETTKPGKPRFGSPKSSAPDEPDPSTEPEPSDKTPPKPKSAPIRSGTLASIPDDVTIVPGIPVRAKNEGKFADATIMEIVDDEHVEVKWTSGRGLTSTVPRADLVVQPKVLEVLQQPDAEQKFASRADRIRGNVPSRPYPRTEYLIRLSLPKNAVRVTEETPLRIGAKVGLNNFDQITGRDRWWEATVTDLNWDGAVRIHIEGQSDFHDGDIDRECLIIAQSELDRLLAVQQETDLGGESDEEAEKLIPLDPDLKLVRGTPVFADLQDGPQEATVIDIVDDSLHVVGDAVGGSDTEEVPRSRIKIRAKVVQALSIPGTEEKLQRRADRIAESVATYPYPTPDYIPPTELPPGSVRVTDATPLEIGTVLGLYSQNRWWEVQILDLNWDGSVRIRVIGEGDSFDGDIERRCLIVSKTVLNRLENSSKAEKSPFTRTVASTSPTTPKTRPEMTAPRKTSPTAPPSSTSAAGDYKLVLKGFGRKKIGVAQVVSDLTGQEYGDVLKLLEQLPVDVQSNLSKADAESAARKLRAAGAQVDVTVN